MIFVDTGAWFAAFVPNDADHEAANRWLDGNRDQLVTSDYVLDEVLTLFKARGEFERGIRLGSGLLAQRVARLELVHSTDLDAAYTVFRTHRDKRWSFTDCVSRVVMERLGITEAFSFDDHFRQFGTVTVVP